MIMSADFELQRLIDIICQDINNRFFATLDTYAKRFIRSSVRAYYSAYHPKYYDRSYSLYTMAKPERTANGFTIVSGPEYSQGGHRSGEDFIYGKMFQEGYHGGEDYGAGHPSPGTMLWRTPYPEFTSWGEPAKRTDPPYDLLVEQWNSFAETEAEQLKTKIIKETIGSYKHEFMRVINLRKKELDEQRR